MVDGGVNWVEGRLLYESNHQENGWPHNIREDSEKLRWAPLRTEMIPVL
jgi:hypothetical protein